MAVLSASNARDSTICHDIPAQAPQRFCVSPASHVGTRASHASRSTQGDQPMARVRRSTGSSASLFEQLESRTMFAAGDVDFATQVNFGVAAGAHDAVVQSDGKT